MNVKKIQNLPNFTFNDLYCKKMLILRKLTKYYVFFGKFKFF